MGGVARQPRARVGRGRDKGRPRQGALAAPPPSRPTQGTNKKSALAGEGDGCAKSVDCHLVWETTTNYREASRASSGRNHQQVDKGTPVEAPKEKGRGGQGRGASRRTLPSAGRSEGWPARPPIRAPVPDAQAARRARGPRQRGNGPPAHRGPPCRSAAAKQHRPVRWARVPWDRALAGKPVGVVGGVGRRCRNRQRPQPPGWCRPWTAQPIVRPGAPPTASVGSPLSAARAGWPVTGRCPGAQGVIAGEGDGCAKLGGRCPRPPPSKAEGEVAGEQRPCRRG